MANLTQHLTSISPDLRSGPSPGRRLLALVLCSMLVLGSVLPGVALAGEADSEGEGTSPSIELPEPPDFDPGGEETDLEEVPATGGGEEGGAVETEPEVDIEAPPPEEVTSAAIEAPAEAPPPQPVAVPEPATSAPEPESVQQAAAEPPNSEPVANQSITAPKQMPDRHSASARAPAEASPPAQPAQQEAPPPPQPATAPPADLGRDLAGKDSYVVRPGDCLWHIAASLLPGNAGTEAVAREVARLWQLNEDRIGTGDPNLIYAGTELRLR
jgi:outer membrane biosynthesis protein TonB